MTIEDLHKNIRMLIPETDGRYFDPPDIDRFIHMSVIDMYNQEYKVYEESQRITEWMAFFKAESALAVAGGVANLPGNLFYITKLLGTKIGSTVVAKKATLATDQTANDLIVSEAFAPNEDNILVERIANTLKVRPVSISEITVSFLRRPNKAVFGYTASVNGFSFVYNVGTSTQIDFPEQGHVEIQNKTCRYMGIPMERQALVQLEAVSRQGNQPEAR